MTAEKAESGQSDQSDVPHHLVSPRVLGRMRRGAAVVNVSHGGLVDATALAEALHSGHVSGAALDVFAQETPA
ncbi:NAD(P)-dependent oxidoreductase [Streptomyces sp. NPDC005811]|uniref:NAD(P)-dependent oxidoreductase n=1 Tax=Streptomyces sp. NPDC005811 TaxID=3154565 RepID=UPI0033E23AC9